MGELATVKLLVAEARKRLSKDQFYLFVNIKVAKNMGGNNALLYACNSKESNGSLVDYLIGQAGANPDVRNDYDVSCIMLATKRASLNILQLLLLRGIDISFADKNGCNALHIAAVSGHYHIVYMLLVQSRK